MDDAAIHITAMEAINQLKVEIRLTVVDRQGRGVIQVEAVAWDNRESYGEVPPSVSVKSTCLAMNVTSLAAAVIHVLYLLDGKLGRKELGGSGSG
jgi:hypothetical protein